MATAAERQRRYRAHKRGDHSLCDPNRGCNGVTPVTGGSAGSGPAAPTGLGARGHRLWAALAESIPGPAHLVLVEEACRIADRLDRLDRALVDSEEIGVEPPDASNDFAMMRLPVDIERGIE